MMSKKYVIVMALIGIFSISATAMPSYASEANPYCDLVSDEYMESGGSCHDRKDYYDGGPNDGLYPCNDGSARTDWEDCPDVSGFDYSVYNDDTSGCQEEDDYCDADEGCKSPSVDCIDDVNIGDDGENSDGGESEEGGGEGESVSEEDSLFGS
jgi:hypothetical protein